tara:strand:- start:684 stop:1229 length:546 start_codon:yes stop_codon:yes gene_type:complete
MLLTINNLINYDDIMNHIYSFLSTVDDQTAVTCINKRLYELFKSKSYFAIQKENLILEMAYNYNDIFICINAECREEYNNITKYDIDYSLDKNLNKKKIVGNVIFFYPKILTKYSVINNVTNPSQYILTHWYRYEQCKNGPKIKRFIPYCELCMHKYVNYGYRDDGDIVPFGYSEEYIKNL